MAKRKSNSIDGMSPRQVAALLCEAIPDLKEVISQAELELAVDDRGWIGGPHKLAGEMDERTRLQRIAESRVYWRCEPLSKQGVRLWTNYCFGNGMTYKAEDPAVQKKLDAFCKNRRNRHIMNAAGQQRSSKKLLVDGDVFFGIVNRQVVRYVDPVQVTMITDPDDDERVLCYRRETKDQKVFYYADWALDDAGRALAEQQKDPIRQTSIKLNDDTLIYHHAFDPLGKWGNGLLSSVGDWTRENRRFMQARVSLTQALAKFAWKTKVKGGQAVINDVKTRMQSSLVAGGYAQGVERNPVNAPGGNWLENYGIDTTPMPRATGAGDAKEDSNALKLMFCAGTGIMLHYLGDPSTGNLATATAMELPMLKQFAAYQQQWTDAYRDIFSIILEEDPDTEPALIDIDLPPILAADLTEQADFIQKTASVFPEMKVPEVLQMLLTSLGVNNLAEVMKSIEKQREKIDADQKANQAAMLAAAGAKVNPGQPSLAANNVQEALNRLAAAMEESNRYEPVLAEV